MDIKIEGITREIMETALAQAKAGRLHILGEMNKVIGAPRAEMSEHAPRIIEFKIHPEKIRDVIGKGGSVIRAITEETGATIDIDDDGLVKIFSVDKAAGEEAKRRIELITADVEVGTIYEGKVARLMDFGAFVTILPGATAWCTSPRSARSASRTSATSSRKATWSASRCWRWTSRAASAQHEGAGRLIRGGSGPGAAGSYE